MFKFTAIESMKAISVQRPDYLIPYLQLSYESLSISYELYMPFRESFVHNISN